MAFKAASQLGVALFEDTDPVGLRPGRSDEEGTTAIESERLSVPESGLKRDKISVRELARQVAKSELYPRFFDACRRATEPI